MATSASPPPSMANTPISSVPPKRFFIARRIRYWWLRSPSKLSTVSTICSSTRGPAMVPSLVTWPTSTTAVSRCLGEADQLLRRGAHLADGARRALDQVAECIVWMESMTSKRRRLAVGHAWSGCRGPKSPRRARPAPRRARAGARAAAPGWRLPRRKHRRRAGPRCASRAATWSSKVDLPMPGIAADQHGRAGDDSAADRPVELGDPARQPLRQCDFGIEADQRDRLPAGRKVVLGGEDAVRPTLSCTSVFHSAQSAHWPCQRDATDPQAWQT